MAIKPTDPIIAKPGDDEQIFILRAQDITAPKMVMEWVAENFFNVSDQKPRDAFGCAFRMKAYKHNEDTGLNAIYALATGSSFQRVV